MTVTTQELLPIAARLQGRKIGSIGGSNVFSVASGWPAGQLRAESNVATVSTATELESALQDDQVSTLFVPRDTFGWSMLERILQRNSLVKTIYWEE